MSAGKKIRISVKCCVKNCSNETKKINKSHGVTYHLFPKDPKLRSSWISALGMEEPKIKSLVCSQHFRTEDFFVNKRGLRRLKMGVVPVATPLNTPTAVAAMRVCRMCLSTKRKMYNMSKQNILEHYEKLTATKGSKSDALPHHVCWECKARLRSFARLRSAALRSLKLLRSFYDTVTNHIEASKDVSRIIDKHSKKLSSALTRTHSEVNYADYHFIYSETIPNYVDINVSDVKTELGDTNDSEFDINKPEFNDNEKCDDKNDIFDANNDKSDIFDANNDKSDIFDDKLENVINYADLKDDSFDRFDMNDHFDSSDDDDCLKTVREKKMEEQKLEELENEEMFDVTELSYEEQMQEIEKRKESDNYKYAGFQCDVCFKGFVFKKAYVAHMTKHTDAWGSHECSLCKVRFKTPRRLKFHTVRSHSQRYSCRRCDYVTNAPYSAQLHEKFHKGEKYKCPHCEKEFDKKSSCMTHIRIKHPSDIVCELCGYSFVSANGLQMHKQIKHRLDEKEIPPDGPRCVECDIKFVSEEALNTHRQQSFKHNSAPKSVGRPAGQKRFMKKKTMAKGVGADVSCEQCDMQLPDFKSYYAHFRRAHPGKNRTNFGSLRTSIMCEVCGRVFQSLCQLQDHSFTHTDSKQFPCGSCDKRFQTKYKLTMHQRIHLKRQYPCDVCGNKFSSAGNLKNHMILHMGLTFECEICGKCFKHPQSKKSHMDYIHFDKPQRSRAKRKE